MSGECPTCGRPVARTRNGTVARHGPRGNICPGSNKNPTEDGRSG